MFFFKSGHCAVWDQSEGGGCAADAGLPRLNEYMPEADEGRAFLAISLHSRREITSLTSLSRMALVLNTSQRMSKSEMPAISTSLMIESVKSTSRKQAHLVMWAHAPALPRTRAATARNDSSRSCCMRMSSARITLVATTMTASDSMVAMTTEVGFLPKYMGPFCAGYRTIRRRRIGRVVMTRRRGRDRIRTRTHPIDV